MAAAVGSTPNGSLELPLEAECQRIPSESGLSLPNVFVTPPEEEYDSPPWCCFDADKDAQPGAFVCEGLVGEDFDYAAHAEDGIFSRDTAFTMADNEEREDVFVMRSLVQEAEHLREKLRSLELSVGTRSSTAYTRVGGEELVDEPDATPTTFTSSAARPEQKVKRMKSLFSFKALGRKRSDKNDPSSTFHASVSENDLGFSLSKDRDMEADSVRSGCSSSSRKASFFSRFKILSKKSTAAPVEDALGARTSTSAYQSYDEVSVSQDHDVVLKRRFSIFDLSRRRSSISSQSMATTIPTVPSIIRSMNQSNSSLSTSSVPPTPDAAICDLSSPPASPTEKLSGGISPADTSSLMSSMNVHSVDNIAASLMLPSPHAVISDGTFALDPLHFESLQFNSDDFP